MQSKFLSSLRFYGKIYSDAGNIPKQKKIAQGPIDQKVKLSFDAKTIKYLKH